MGILDYLGGWRTRPRDPRQEIAVKLAKEIPEEVFERQWYTTSALVPARVTREEALAVPAVKRARDLIAATLGGMPVGWFGPDQRGSSLSRLLEQPEVGRPRSVSMTNLFEDLLFESLSFWRIVQFGWHGYPEKVKRIEPGLVTPDKDPAWVWVENERIPASDLIVFESPNPAILVHGAKAIRTCLRLETAANKYAEAPPALGIFSPKEDADPADSDRINTMLENYTTGRQTRAYGWVGTAIELHEAKAMTPEQLQLVGSRAAAVLEIARLCGIDAEYLEVAQNSRTYLNNESRRQDFLDFTLAPYVSAVQDRLSMNDVSPRGYYAKFNFNAFMRTDTKGRMEAYEIGLRVGAYTKDEIRELEDKPPLSPEERTQVTVTASREITSNPGSALVPYYAAFDSGRTEFVDFAPGPERSMFTAAKDRRIIAGLAIPFNRVGLNRGRRWRFQKGSLYWAHDISRVKHLEDHEISAARGRLEFIEEREDGIYTRSRITEGPEGDRLLALAADRVKDGLSAGVVIEDFIPDPQHPGVNLVTRGRIEEITSTALPAFDDARADYVAASRYPTGQESNMPCTQCGHVHAPGTPCVQTPTTAQFQGEQGQQNQNADQRPAQQQSQVQQPVGATFSAYPPGGYPVYGPGQGGYPVYAPQPVPQPGMVTPQVPVAPWGFGPQQATQGQQQVLPQREPVGPGAVQEQVNKAATQVKEDSPYRFDGRHGRHEFSTDLLAMFRGEPEAGSRIQQFMADHAEAKFAVATTDVNELSPTRNRPDMYVDQLDYTYPIWSAINKGSLTDITSFSVPKWESSANLVGDHTEGQEPAQTGSFTTTGQDIVPSAVSGQTEITRETWDKGGSPQLSQLLWREINRAYYEALEIAACAHLDSLTPTQIAITAGLVDDDLDDEITAAFAGLHFIRGGHRFRDLVLHDDLYTALVNARDTTGRKLYPSIGPINTSGTTAPLLGSVEVCGLTGKPAWATMAGNGGDGSSYLFNRDDVHGWATPPQRLQLADSVALIQIGVWGYKAFATTRLAGVREITYSPDEGS